jgi:hypothetical protein
MKIRFLLDENLSPRIKLAILRYNDNIDILRVGDENVPRLGTSDPDISCLSRKKQTDTCNRQSCHYAGSYICTPVIRRSSLGYFRSSS